MKTHNELHKEWMKNPEYQAAYEEELKKEKLQAIISVLCLLSVIGA